MINTRMGTFLAMATLVAIGQGLAPKATFGQQPDSLPLPPRAPTSSTPEPVYQPASEERPRRPAADQPVDDLDQSDWPTRFLRSSGLLDIDAVALNDELRRRYPYHTRDELVDVLVRDASLRSGMIGAVAALPAMVPMAGTSLRIGALIPEFYYVLQEQAKMVMRIAELHGYVPKEEDKVTELLVVMGVSASLANGAEAVETFLEMAAARSLATGASSAGRIAAKAIPLIGVATSFGLDYSATRMIGAAARRFYTRRSARETEDARHALELPAYRNAALAALRLAAAPGGISDDEREHVERLARDTALESDAGEVTWATTEADIEALASVPWHVQEHVLRLALRTQYSDSNRNRSELASYEKLLRRLGIDATDPETRHRLDRLEREERKHRGPAARRDRRPHGTPRLRAVGRGLTEALEESMAAGS